MKRLEGLDPAPRRRLNRKPIEDPASRRHRAHAPRCGQLPVARSQCGQGFDPLLGFSIGIGCLAALRAWAWRAAAMMATARASPFASALFKSAKGLFSLIGRKTTCPRRRAPERPASQTPYLIASHGGRDQHGNHQECPRLYDPRDVAPACLPPCKTESGSPLNC